MSARAHPRPVPTASLLGLLLLAIVMPRIAAAAVDYGWLQRGVVKVVAVGENAKEVGAGIVLSSAAPDGTLILTAHHVLMGARDITVTYFDKRYDAFEGRVRHFDEALDIAVVEVAVAADQSVPADLPEYVIADFANVREGDRVSVIGHPLDLDWLSSIQTNVIARLDDRGDSRKFRLTNTAIERGSSGGPIFDEGGALVGIVTRFDPIHAIAVRMDVVGKMLEEDWQVAASAFAPASWPPNAVPGATYIVRGGENVRNPPVKAAGQAAAGRG